MADLSRRQRVTQLDWHCEKDVALLVLQGASTQSIAVALHLSQHTVQGHLKRIFSKVGVTTRRDLTARLTLD
jgi:DNA-binding CsgD family transcriptional regulator